MEGCSKSSYVEAFLQNVTIIVFLRPLNERESRLSMKNEPQNMPKVDTEWNTFAPLLRDYFLTRDALIS
jgi:hypothetical protein